MHNTHAKENLERPVFIISSTIKLGEYMRAKSQICITAKQLWETNNRLKDDVIKCSPNHCIFNELLQQLITQNLSIGYVIKDFKN